MHLFLLNFILWDLAYNDDCQDSFEPDLSFNIVSVIYDIFWCVSLNKTSNKLLKPQWHYYTSKINHILLISSNTYSMIKFLYIVDLFKSASKQDLHNCIWFIHLKSLFKFIIVLPFLFHISHLLKLLVEKNCLIIFSTFLL